MSGVDPAVYRRAADVIRRGGWCQQEYTDGTAHCTVGAIRRVVGWNDESQWAPYTQHLATDHLGEKIGCPCGCDARTSGIGPVAEWNDEPGRTAADVITLLEQAAEKAEASEVLTP